MRRCETFASTPPSTAEILQTELQRRLGRRALTMVACIGADAAHLWPEERRSIQQAIVSRQREFATGRACARRLLSRLGCPEMALPPDSDRVPSWPEGFVGSISHAGDLCAVVVGARSSVGGVGIDIELEGPLERELWEIVLSERERAWLMTLPLHLRPLRAKVLFSVKEAVYKLQFPATRARIDFHAVEVELLLDSFRARLACDVPWWDHVEGIVCVAPGFNVTMALASTELESTDTAATAADFRY